eukprot:2653046-Amphidinium_carterae.2
MSGTKEHRIASAGRAELATVHNAFSCHVMNHVSYACWLLASAKALTTALKDPKKSSKDLDQQGSACCEDDA